MTAILSENRAYRYRLDRNLGFEGGGRVLFVMLNPSTADATADDLTVRKCIGFGRRWACSDLTVVNLFPFRATDPKDLFAAHMMHGELVDAAEGRMGLESRNDQVIRAAARECGLRICAWGNTGRSLLSVQRRIGDVYEILRDTRWVGGPGVRVSCLGRTRDGSPRHPSRLAYDTPVVPWEPR